MLRAESVNDAPRKPSDIRRELTMNVVDYLTHRDNFKYIHMGKNDTLRPNWAADE
jgi:hypothetical protein